MEWEKQENYNGFVDCWLVGEKYFDEKSSTFSWTFTADVFINKKRNSATVEFDVLNLPRHLIEDLEWRTLEDGIIDLTLILAVMNEVRNLAAENKIKIFSDDFQNFRACFEVKSIDRQEIENKILQVRKALSLNITENGDIFG